VSATGGAAPDENGAAPRDLASAVAALAAEPGLLPIAGCTDLMVTLGDGRWERRRALDLLALPELRGIRELADGGVEIGATTTFTELRRSPLVRSRWPALAAAAAVVGGWQIQNRATLGGNVVNASPAGDSLPVLLALDATAIAASAAGRREIAYSGLHTGYRETALRPGELLIAIRLPAPRPGTVQRFRKVGTRAAQAISKVVVALAAELHGGRIARLRLAAGSVAAVPLRLVAVEEALAGRALGEETAALGGRLAAAAVTPIDDVRSTAEYRRFALENVVRGMLANLAEEPAAAS
jgi:CO/xanthine dehydrogenase FAD-binding subunit